jgi:hypothetical protein
METIHLIIAIGTGLMVLYADEQALAWVLGKKDVMSSGRVHFLHRAVTVGLTLLLLTGGYMYAQAAPAYLTLRPFLVKMVVIAAVIINTYAINRFSNVALTKSFASLSQKEKLPLFISGGVSFAGWVTAFICGLLIS